MLELEQVAWRVLNQVNVNSEQGVRFGGAEIATIILVLKIIVEAYECFARNQSRALSESRNPGLLQRMWIKHYVKKGLRKSNSHLDANEVYRAILDVGKTITLEELQSATSEIRGLS